MSERELAQLFGRASREIDAMQRARIRELQGVERSMFEAMVKKLTEALDAGGGRVTTRRGSASINELVDQVFRAMERGPLKTFYQRSLNDLFTILGNNDTYNAALFSLVSKAGDKRYKEMRSSVDRIMRGRIGIDDKGKTIAGGYFDNLLGSTAAKTEVQQIINAGVNAGIPMGKLMRQVEITIKGTREIPGALSKQLQGHIFDTYQQFDRASNDVYAKKLKLDTFIYQGGLIETSREFCIKRDGKVFTLEETENWKCDSKLPKKKSEGNCAETYNPVVDMGRWNCRHRTRFISRGLAEQLRPDLVAEKQKPATDTSGQPPQSGFVPVKTIQEAGTRIQASGVMHFEPKGFSVEHANATIEALESIPQQAIPDAIGNGKAFADFTNRPIGRSADSWYGVSIEYPNIYAQGRITDIGRTINARIVGINTRQYKTPADITARKVFVNKFYREKNGRDYFFNTDGRLTHFHEYGHIYDGRLSTLSDKLEWRQIASRWHYESQFDVLKSPSEAFAEAFADFYGNGGARLPDYVLKFFKDLEP